MLLSTDNSVSWKNLIIALLLETDAIASRFQNNASENIGLENNQGKAHRFQAIKKPCCTTGPRASHRCEKIRRRSSRPLVQLWGELFVGQTEFPQPIRGAKTGVMDAAEESRHPFTSTPIRMSQSLLLLRFSIVIIRAASDCLIEVMERPKRDAA
jgi:hypothetical protein